MLFDERALNQWKGGILANPFSSTKTYSRTTFYFIQFFFKFYLFITSIISDLIHFKMIFIECYLMNAL